MEHVMMVDYQGLLAGDRVKVLREERDSGYLVYVVKDAAGDELKPLADDVRGVQDVRNELTRLDKRRAELVAILGEDT